MPSNDTRNGRTEDANGFLAFIRWLLQSPELEYTRAVKLLIGTAASFGSVLLVLLAIFITDPTVNHNVKVGVGAAMGTGVTSSLFAIGRRWWKRRRDKDNISGPSGPGSPPEAPASD